MTRIHCLAGAARPAQVAITTAVFMAMFQLDALELLGADHALVASRGLSEALVIGAALALSSSAFVLQLLAEREELATTFGQATLGTLLLQARKGSRGRRMCSTWLRLRVVLLLCRLSFYFIILYYFFIYYYSFFSLMHRRLSLAAGASPHLLALLKLN